MDLIHGNLTYVFRENFVSGTGGGLDDDGCGEDEHVSPGSSDGDGLGARLAPGSFSRRLLRSKKREPPGDGGVMAFYRHVLGK